MSFLLPLSEQRTGSLDIRMRNRILAPAAERTTAMLGIVRHFR